jgi:hypothetical protein
MYHIKIVSITIKKIISIILTEFRLDNANKYVGAMAMTNESKPFLETLPEPKKPISRLDDRKNITNNKNKNTTDK